MHSGTQVPELQSKIQALLADRSATKADVIGMINEVNSSGAPPVGGPLNTDGRAEGRALTVNERMADILQSEPHAIWWMAKEWAEKLGMSASTVTLSETWMTTIKYSREMLKGPRTARRRRK